jgi:hypothetical protein
MALAICLTEGKLSPANGLILPLLMIFQTASYVELRLLIIKGEQ